MTTVTSAFKIPGEILRQERGSGCLKHDCVIEHLLPARDDPGRMAGVFVCYAHEDTPLVLPWVDRLIRQGLMVLYDHGGLRGGYWFDELAPAIDDCRAMIFVVSPRSIASRNCQMELQYAILAGKPVAFTPLGALEQELETS